MNKNDQFQLEKERRDQLNKFARALASGQTGLLNRTGQTIVPGDLVFYIPAEPTAYSIVDVAPCMDVRLPPGLLNVTIMALPFVVQVPAGQQWRQALPTGMKGDVVPMEIRQALEKVIASAGRRVDMIRTEEGTPDGGGQTTPDPAGEPPTTPPDDDSGGSTPPTLQ